VAAYPAAPFTCAVSGRLAPWRVHRRLGSCRRLGARARVDNMPGQDLWWLGEWASILAVIALFLSAPRQMLPHYGGAERKRIRVGGERMPHFRYAID